MLKDTVSIDVQGFFDNNNNIILKEIGIVFEKDQNLNNSFLIEPPYDFTLLNTKENEISKMKFHEEIDQIIEQLKGQIIGQHFQNTETKFMNRGGHDFKTTN